MTRKMTAEEAREQGFAVDDTVYPWLAYKGPRFSPEKSFLVYTDMEATIRNQPRRMQDFKAACLTCGASDHTHNEHFEVAFTSAVTKEPYAVPADIKEAATRIARSYGLRGICDPMYVANVIAKETGRGDGQSNFWEPGTEDDRTGAVRFDPGWERED